VFFKLKRGNTSKKAPGTKTAGRRKKAFDENRQRGTQNTDCSTEIGIHETFGGVVQSCQGIDTDQATCFVLGLTLTVLS
jgi:hypothetical protein